MELDPAHKTAYRAIAREEARNVVADALSSIDDGETRREVLEAIGMVGLGAAAGGAGLAALAGSAAADASTSDGDGDVGTPGDRVDVFADGVDATSILTEKANITAETFVLARRSSSTSSTSSGQWTNIADTEDEDVLNELDANLKFNPDETGWYRVTGAVGIFGATDGNRIQIAVRDVDTPAIVDNGDQRSTLPDTNDDIPFVFVVNMTAGTNYEVQCTNIDGSYRVGQGAGESSRYNIERMVVSP